MHEHDDPEPPALTHQHLGPVGADQAVDHDDLTRRERGERRRQGGCREPTDHGRCSPRTSCERTSHPRPVRPRASIRS